MNKLYTIDTALQRVAQWRELSLSIVFTNGCYDVLHVGHLEQLEQAKAQGHRLIVGLNSDSSVYQLKGEGRPYNCQANRARMLAALECVDAVVIFNTPTPLSLILALHPDVLVKGADYNVKNIAGASDVLGWGGKVILVPLVATQSTTNILGKLT